MTNFLYFLAIKERVVSGPTIESLRPPFQLINKVRPSGFVAERAEPIKADKRDAELEWGMGMSGPCKKSHLKAT